MTVINRGDFVILLNYMWKNTTHIACVVNSRGNVLEVSEGKGSDCRSYSVYRAYVRKATEKEKRLAEFRANVTGLYN